VGEVLDGGRKETFQKLNDAVAQAQDVRVAPGWGVRESVRE